MKTFSNSKKSQNRTKCLLSEKWRKSDRV